MDKTAKKLKIISGFSQVISAYHVNYEGSFFGHSHSHRDICHLSYIINGYARINISGKDFPLHENQAVFVNAGQKHFSYEKDKHKKYELLEVKFSLDGGRRISGIPPVVHIHSSREELVNALHELINEFNMETTYRELALQTALTRIFILYLRNFEGGKNKPAFAINQKIRDNNNKKIEQAIAFIQDNYQRPITLEDIANEVQKSPSNLSHIFKEFTGISPIAYLLNYRFSRAIILMEKTDHKLSRIAEAVGFKDQHHFSRLFKKKLRLPPRSYMACHRH